MARRPEHALPAAETYGEKEAITYARSTRLSGVQTELAARCVELLGLQETPSLLLDIGCGTGFSTAVAREAGHIVIGTDLSGEMLAQTRNEDSDSNDDDDEDDEEMGDAGNTNGNSKSNSSDFMRSDAGEGVPFRMGTFDGAISVSAIQWLCSAASADQHPIRRLRHFFATLYAALRQRSRAVLQFYPDSPAQLELITAAATRAGFSGGLLIDYPESARAKKYYLVLTAGPPAPGSVAPTAKGTAEDENRNKKVAVAPRRRFKNNNNQASRKDRVIEKKDRRRRQGHQTHKDSKYTGRKRRHKF